MDPYEDGLARTAALWGEQAAAWHVGRGMHWVEHERVQQRINLKVAGEYGIDRYGYFVRQYFAGKLPVERVLTLGCGAGEFERGMSTYGFSRRHDAVDISAPAIAQAIEAADAAQLRHVHYRVEDLNRIELPSQTYDVIFGISSVHHVATLERLFEQVANALKPGGYFFLDEFIGPNQFQWLDAQLDAVNEQLRVMPPALRRRISNPRREKTLETRPTIAEMNQSDPSEAIRAAEIVPLLPRYFDVLEFKGQGGSLLHLLLEDIAGNFRADTPGSLDYLQSLFDVEDRLISEGVLTHDFATIIARKRAGL